MKETLKTIAVFAFGWILTVILFKLSALIIGHDLHPIVTLFGIFGGFLAFILYLKREDL